MTTSWIGSYHLGGAKGLEFASTPSYQISAMKDFCIKPVCAAEEGLWGHTKSASIQMEATWNVGGQADRLRQAGHKGAYTRSVVAHTSITTNIIFPVQGRGQGKSPILYGRDASVSLVYSRSATYRCTMFD